MKIGDTIKILPSIALQEMRLEELVNTEAIISDIVYHANKIDGCWVKLPTNYLGEEEWFVPYNSIGKWN